VERVGKERLSYDTRTLSTISVHYGEGNRALEIKHCDRGATTEYDMKASHSGLVEAFLASETPPLVISSSHLYSVRVQLHYSCFWSI